MLFSLKLVLFAAKYKHAFYVHSVSLRFYCYCKFCSRLSFESGLKFCLSQPSVKHLTLLLLSFGSRWRFLPGPNQLGTPGGRRVFWEGCPLILIHVHIFHGGLGPLRTAVTTCKYRVSLDVCWWYLCVLSKCTLVAKNTRCVPGIWRIAWDYCQLLTF